jgi:hypothetical protein
LRFCAYGEQDMLLRIFPGHKSRVPHISLVFREMWDTTNLNVIRRLGPKAEGWSAAVSHISRKTSEIWGTRDLWPGRISRGSAKQNRLIFRKYYKGLAVATSFLRDLLVI